MVPQHKKRFALTLISLTAIACTTAFVAVGCSDDADPFPPPADTGVDGTVADSTTDTGTTDSTPVDTGTDTTDTALPDAPMSPAMFPRVVVQTYCERLKNCCGSTFDMPECVSYFDKTTRLGGIFGLSEWTPALDSGNVAYDSTAAATCIADIQGWSCTTVTSANYAKAQKDCTAALVGKLAIGATGCKMSVECVAGAYCEPATTDGGMGTCRALKAVGETCTDVYGTECTYLGNGTPANYCKAGADGGPRTCQPAENAGAACEINAGCKSLLCFDTCESEFTFSDPGVSGGLCEFFSKKADAGADADAADAPADGG